MDPAPTDDLPMPLSERRHPARAALGRDLFALAERLDEPLLVVPPTGLAYANPAAHRLLALIEGGNCDAGSDCAARLLAHLPPIASAAGNGGHARTLVTVEAADGPPRTLQVSEIALASSEDGALAPRCLLLHDRTDEQRREAELETRHAELEQAYHRLAGAQEQLLQSEKMASIGQLAAGVAHEINNPIGYVGSNLSTLQDYLRTLLTVLAAYERALPPHAQGEAVAEIAEMRARFDLDYVLRDLPELLSESREGIERVTKIVQDLKDFSHAGRGEAWVLADLHKGLDSTINIVWNELKYKARLERRYGVLPPVQCLPSELNQVFMNMLVNAAHAIREQGEIVVETGAHDGEVWIAISDTGDGIPEEHLARVFDPFFTTKPVGQGSGLGLSISYTIVAKHNGRIEVDSRPGEGTRFRIVLPVVQPPTPAAR